MNHRQRFRTTMYYQSRDRVPLYDFNYWTETIDSWHEQGLPGRFDLGSTHEFFGLARSITHKGTVPVQFARVGLKLRADWLTDRHYRMIDYNDNILSEGTIQHGELTIPSNLPVYLTLITMP